MATILKYAWNLYAIAYKCLSSEIQKELRSSKWQKLSLEN